MKNPKEESINEILPHADPSGAIAQNDEKREVIKMPFGMGPAGWFMWPYWASWLYGYPWYRAPYYGYYGYPSYGYGTPYAYPYAPMSKEDETTMLQDQAKTLQQELDRINARLKELQKGK